MALFHFLLSSLLVIMTDIFFIRGIVKKNMYV